MFRRSLRITFTGGRAFTAPSAGRLAFNAKRYWPWVKKRFHPHQRLRFRITGKTGDVHVLYNTGHLYGGLGPDGTAFDGTTAISTSFTVRGGCDCETQIWNDQRGKSCWTVPPAEAPL